jgi:AraC-like DNA-binding protein
VLVSISRQKAEFVSRSLGLPIGQVADVNYRAGFNSGGRFYAKSTGILGMTPTRYRSGGINEDGGAIRGSRRVSRRSRRLTAGSPAGRSKVA